MALAVKVGLVILGGVSLIRLSGAYQERLDRHGELAAVVAVETAKLEGLQQRFDRVFSIGGEGRGWDVRFKDGARRPLQGLLEIGRAASRPWRLLCRIPWSVASGVP